MNVNDFDFTIQNQIKKSQQVLLDKGREYAGNDRLHNFRQAAHIQGITLKAALAGMMAKHTVSVYDMCESEDPFTLEQWEEKLTDHINYLLLLKAIVVEEALDGEPVLDELEQDEPLEGLEVAPSPFAGLEALRERAAKDA
jgi:hypothetical protein